MADLIDLRVTALLFYSLHEAQKTGKRLPYITFEEGAGASVQVNTPASDCRHDVWQTAGGENAQLDWTLAHDTHLVRISLSRVGSQPPTTWTALNTSLEQLVGNVHSAASQPQPWSATRVFSARAPRGAKTDDLQPLVSSLADQLTDPGFSVPIEPTPYGWSLQFGAKMLSYSEEQRFWQRWLAWIVPQERAERVDGVFLQPINQGLARIELYLHKSLHHVRQHEAVRAALETTRIELQDSMLTSLRSVDFEKVHYVQPGMEELSRKLMVFLAGKAQTEILLNSLRSNFSSFTEHLERVKLETPGYAKESALIRRSIEQLENDLANAQAISDSSYAFQDIQRSIESNRLERAGMLIGGAATILAGLAIYDNFLDIWNLSVEKSGLALPSPWLRVLLGALAAVFWPFGAYQLVKRHWWRGGISLLIGVLSIILAIVFTVIVNS